MKKIVILFTFFCFIMATSASAQTTTTQKEQNKTEKTVTTRADVSKTSELNDKEYQIKTTTAPESEKQEGTSTTNSTKTTGRISVDKVQAEKRVVTVSKKTNVLPKK